jgi:tRNA A37 methylthiotransferase MiaB
VCWVGEEANPNRSIITKPVATKMAPSLRGSAIVGYYNEDKEDFEGHNKVIEVKNG